MARIRIHPQAYTYKTVCWASHQRPSVGTGSSGRTAQRSGCACNGMDAMTRPATPPAHMCHVCEVKREQPATTMLSPCWASSFSMQHRYATEAW